MNTEDAFDNIILTEHFGMAMSRPDHDRRYERNRNVLVVGGSDSGKTRGFFEPNVMQMSANYLITDPEGESLPSLGHMLDAEGYKVLSFNTVDFSKSLHYNPIAYIQDEADILEFVTCLIDNTTGDKEHAGEPRTIHRKPQEPRRATRGGSARRGSSYLSRLSLLRLFGQVLAG